MVLKDENSSDRSRESRTWKHSAARSTLRRVCQCFVSYFCVCYVLFEQLLAFAPVSGSAQHNASI